LSENSKIQSFQRGSLDVVLYQLLHPRAKEKESAKTNEIIYGRLSVLDFNERQLEFLMFLRKITFNLDESGFVNFLYEMRKAFSKVFPGFISQLDTAAWEKVSADQSLKELVKGKRVALVGPSQHIVGSHSGERIESYDVVVRLNSQWPVAAHLKKDVGSRMDVLFHCCNNDESIHPVFCDEISSVKLICYELGISTSCLLQKTLEQKIPVQNVTPAYWDLENKLGTLPNTGTVATQLLLDTDLAELHIAGLTYMKDPYYQEYRAKGNQPDLWKNDEMPVKIGPHETQSQFQFIKKLLTTDSRVACDTRLQELLHGD